MTASGRCQWRRVTESHRRVSLRLACRGAGRARDPDSLSLSAAPLSRSAWPEPGLSRRKDASLSLARASEPRPTQSTRIQFQHCSARTSGYSVHAELECASEDWQCTWILRRILSYLCFWDQNGDHDVMTGTVCRGPGRRRPWPAGPGSESGLRPSRTRRRSVSVAAGPAPVTRRAQPRRPGGPGPGGSGRALEI